MATEMPPESSSRLRVLVVEDSPFTRLGIATMLRTAQDIEVVGEANGSQEALEIFETCRPDVVLTDIRMPDIDGVELTRRLRQRYPQCYVMVLSDHDGEETVFQALRAGAAGFLTKGASGTDLVAALKTVAAGRRYIPPAISERLAERMLQPALSPREQQVLDGLFKGQSNDQIAQDLSIGKRTVTMFVSSLMFKLGAQTRGEAVAIAIKRGMIMPR